MSRVGRRAHVRLLRRGAADEDGVASDRAEVVTERGDRRVARLAERVGVERDVEARARLARLGRPDGCDDVRSGRRRADGIDLGGVGDEHDRRRARARREGAVDELLPLHRLDLAAEDVRRRQVVVQRERAQRDRAESERRHDPHGPVAALDPVAEPAPGATPGGVLGAEARHERPEGATAADQEQRGEHRQHRGGGNRDAHRADRAEPRRGVDLGERQAEEGRHDRPCRGEDRRARLAHRDSHRLVLVLHEPQLLPVARGEEQRVVGAGPEDEHEQDAADLAVDDDAVGGEQVPEPADDGLGEDHGEERQEPEDRAAVDDHEQEEHEPDGREEQRGVDPLERLARVGGEARGAVTFTSRPGGRSSAAISRMLSTASISTSSSPPATIGAVRRAPLPSFEKTGGVTVVTPSMSAAMIAARRSATAARVRGSNVSASSYTMIAGVACPDANPSEAFSTLTDSASPGRKLEGSFFWADSNLPASGPSAAASTSQSAEHEELRAAARDDCG